MYWPALVWAILLRLVAWLRLAPPNLKKLKAFKTGLRLAPPNLKKLKAFKTGELVG